jgi:hypothetical protein
MLIRLSQTYLNHLETCPRKFQLIYLEQLSSPISPDQEEKLAWGKQFHLLMQQRELGLPVEPLFQADPKMWESFQAIAQAAPEIFLSNPKPATFRQAEHLRTWKIDNFLLTVVYDLLIAEENSAQIIDWKTYPRPPVRQKVAENWQTRLYLLVLAETSDYLPEQLSMTYWFVESARDKSSEKYRDGHRDGHRDERSRSSQCLKFISDRQQHEQTKQDLSQLLTQLQSWLKDYENGQPFPQVNENSGKCQKCQFSVICKRDLVPVGAKHSG